MSAGGQRNRYAHALPCLWRAPPCRAVPCRSDWPSPCTCLQDSCDVVLFYDFDEDATGTDGGVAACENKKGYKPGWIGDNKYYPKFCSTATEQTSSQLGASPQANTRKTIESSFLRELNSTHVSAVSWLTNELRTAPIKGKGLVASIAASVGWLLLLACDALAVICRRIITPPHFRCVQTTMACLKNGDNYCFKDFEATLLALDNKLFPTLDQSPFGATEVAALEKILSEDICTECNKLLGDYVYLTWDDVSDDEKYLKAFLEMTCSTAPDDEGVEEWCLPVTKDMEDEGPVMDPDAAGYDEFKFEDFILDQADLWCDDLCVKSIKIKEKEMYMIDLNANPSWECHEGSGEPQGPCSQAQKEQKTRKLEQEETVESTYCDVVSLHATHRTAISK